MTTILVNIILPLTRKLVNTKKKNVLAAKDNTILRGRAFSEKRGRGQQKSPAPTETNIRQGGGIMGGDGEIGYCRPAKR